MDIQIGSWYLVHDKTFKQLIIGKVLSAASEQVGIHCCYKLTGQSVWGSDNAQISIAPSDVICQVHDMPNHLASYRESVVEPEGSLSFSFYAKLRSMIERAWPV